jgi:phage terminase small subunit
MTQKEKRFADEYIICLNGSQAYLKLNPGSKNADVRAAQLMSNPEVKKYIANKLENISEQLNLKAVDVIREIKDLAFTDIKNYLTFDKKGVTFKNSDDIDTRAISEVSSDKTTSKLGEDIINENVKFKLKLYDKQKALEMLGKYFKLFIDQHEVRVFSEAEAKEKIENLFLK